MTKLAALDVEASEIEGKIEAKTEAGKPIERELAKLEKLNDEYTAARQTMVALVRESDRSTGHAFVVFRATHTVHS